MNILVSACLLGVNCRYNGQTVDICESIRNLKNEHHLIPVCPEIFGGLPTPREACEIKKGRVVTPLGNDVTQDFEQGAREVLNLAKFYDCKFAILKERSPSCGHGEIYDGNFSGQKVKGDGITAALLAQSGIKVIGESEIEQYF